MIDVCSRKWPRLNLIEVENLKKWIEFNPVCYIEKVQFGELAKQKYTDDLSLLRIKNLFFNKKMMENWIKSSVIIIWKNIILLKKIVSIMI